MELHEFLTLAREYAALGWAVQEQLTTIAESGDLEDAHERGKLNINAVRMIRQFLADNAGDIDPEYENIEKIDGFLALYQEGEVA
jgi:hypothetical protein